MRDDIEPISVSRDNHYGTRVGVYDPALAHRAAFRKFLTTYYWYEFPSTVDIVARTETLEDANKPNFDSLTNHRYQVLRRPTPGFPPISLANCQTVMFQRHFILEPDTDYPLFVTAKQFWRAEPEANWDDADAFTLILLHSTSFHKETWEPTLRYFFDGVQKRRHRTSTPKIKCAWVIECPNHGESAALNDRALQRPPFYCNFGCEKYAEAAHRFMLRGPTFPTPVDFRREKLVGIGHSLGGVGISILPTLEPTFSFCALILIEPLLSPGGIDKLRDLQVNLINGAYERRDVWPSRKSASRYFRERTSWDANVLDAYVQHGLRPCKGVGQEPENDSVTLACSREEEATMYRDMTGPQRGIESLNKLSTTIPIGVIFGDKNDYIPREVQDVLVDPTSGRCFQAVTRIGGVGHLIPQHIPAELSWVILDVWSKLLPTIDTSSKL